MSSQNGTDNGCGASSASLTFTTRSDRSSMMHLLQKTLKPLRPRLVAPPKKPWPAGSIQLDPDSSAEKKCRIEPHYRQEIWSYELIPKGLPSDSPAPRHNVYYFAGGSFQNVPSGEHWKTAAELSLRLQKDSTRVQIVSPPLAPNSPAKDSLRSLRKWLEELLREAHNEGHTVALAGDSSGGNLALSLAIGICGGWPSTAASNSAERTAPVGNKVQQEDEQDPAKSGQAEELHSKVDIASTQSHIAAAQAHDADDPLLKARSPYASALTHVLAVCPTVDVRKINPDIAKVSAVDPMLTPEFTQAVAECWRGAVSVTSHPANWHAHTPIGPGGQEEMARVMAASDPRLSPLLANVKVLGECDVTVDGLIAGLDVLGPDAKLFVTKLEEACVRGEWQLWDNMMHCWPLTWSAGLGDGISALAWIETKLRGGSKTDGAAATD